MDKQSDPKKPNLLNALGKHYGGPITHVALSALSAWMIVTGIKGLAGFAVNRQSALADLLGIVMVIGVLRWIRSRHDAR